MAATWEEILAGAGLPGVYRPAVSPVNQALPPLPYAPAAPQQQFSSAFGPTWEEILASAGVRGETPPAPPEEPPPYPPAPLAGEGGYPPVDSGEGGGDGSEGGGGDGTEGGGTEGGTYTGGGSEGGDDGGGGYEGGGSEGGGGDTNEPSYWGSSSDYNLTAMDVGFWNLGEGVRRRYFEAMAERFGGSPEDYESLAQQNRLRGHNSVRFRY